MKKIVLNITAIILFSYGSLAQNVNIPNPDFKAVLLNNPLININSDTEIQVSEAVAFTGEIDCSSWGITDLTGIEAFPNVTELNCSYNNLNSLNLSQNMLVTRLNCSGNNLSTLNLNLHTALTHLYCDANNLTAIDLSQNTGLIEFRSYNNDLTTLDLSANTALVLAECSFNNNLSSINVSQCSALETFYCNENPTLSSLDVSQNTNLVTLWCHTNNLSTLDVSQNPNLVSFQCHSNNLTSLDVSQNTNLTSFFCFGNDLTSLNMKNLSTSTLATFNATLNPNLSCIEVDDVSLATATWTSIDATASYSVNCNTASIEQQLTTKTLNFYPNPTSSNLTIDLNEKITSIKITDITGKTMGNYSATTKMINVSELPFGIYLLHVESENNSLTERFIKE